MITVQLLVEWAVRSAVLVGLGVLLPRLLRVKDPSIRLAVCIAVVCGSLAMPLVSTAFPKWPVSVLPAAESSIEAVVPAPIPASAGVVRSQHQSSTNLGTSLGARPP